jgi:hypothetical protein
MDMDGVWRHSVGDILLFVGNPLPIEMFLLFAMAVSSKFLPGSCFALS